MKSFLLAKMVLFLAPHLVRNGRGTRVGNQLSARIWPPNSAPKADEKVCVCLLAMSDTLCLRVSITKKHTINDVA